MDIGDYVTNGQLLAEIDTPELNQQFAQAKAELDQAKAALDLAKITSDRWSELLKSASVSEQETAEKQADYTLKKANVEAAQANLQRLEDLRDFGRVTAPFPGTITTRNTDIGQLIAADSGRNYSGSRKPVHCGFTSASRNNTSLPLNPARKRNSFFRKPGENFPRHHHAHRWRR